MAPSAPFTIHMVSHWNVRSSCHFWNFWIWSSSWIFWVWILRSCGFGNGRQQRDSESPDSGIVSVLFLLGFMFMLCCTRCSLCKHLSMYQFSSQHSNLCGTCDLCHHTLQLHPSSCTLQQTTVVYRLALERLELPNRRNPRTCNCLPALTSSPVVVRKVRSLSPGIIFPYVTL